MIGIEQGYAREFDWYDEAATALNSIYSKQNKGRHMKNIFGILKTQLTSTATYAILPGYLLIYSLGLFFVLDSVPSVMFLLGQILVAVAGLVIGKSLFLVYLSEGKPNSDVEKEKSKLLSLRVASGMKSLIPMMSSYGLKFIFIGIFVIFVMDFESAREAFTTATSVQFQSFALFLFKFGAFIGLAVWLYPWIKSMVIKTTASNTDGPLTSAKYQAVSESSNSAD